MRFPVWCFFFLLGCASSLTTTEKDSPYATQDAGRSITTTFPTVDDPGGDADFRATTEKLFELNPLQAQKKLRAFIDTHPGRRQNAAVILLLARLQFAAGNATTCLSLLDEIRVTEEPLDRTFIRGLCENRLGHTEKVLELLQPFVASGPPSLAGVVDPDGPFYLYLALAEAMVSKGDKAAAIDQLGQYLQLPGIAEKEREFARQQAEEYANSLPDGAALLALSSPRNALTRAVLGNKATSALRTRGDEAGARQMEQNILAFRQQVGFHVLLINPGLGDVTRLGLAVPLSGALARLGDAILRGAIMVLLREDYSGEKRPYRLVVRDSAATTERSAHGGGAMGAVQSLMRDEGSVGIVTGHDPRAIDLATRDNVPLLLLDERAPGSANTSFQMVHSSDARTNALAKRAWALGARRFAILGPDSPTGKKLAAAFQRTVEAAGGSVTGHIFYPPQATSFGVAIENLRKLPFDSLFIPDDASRLELIAPALASADLWPRQPQQILGSARDVGGPRKGRREALLLSTALSVSPKLLQNAERYVQGALLCPGYYPSEDLRSASFVTRFREIHGQAPSATDAYAYDAVSVLRSAVERGAKNRADVLRIIAMATFEGITGDIRFGSDHTRIDSPIVYVVSGTTIAPLK